MCEACGPIPAAKRRTIAKTPRDTCPDCSAIVRVWVRPLNERPGRCRHCANGAFTLALHNGRLLRCCKRCKAVVNTENGESIRKGAEEYEYTTN